MLTNLDAIPQCDASIRVDRVLQSDPALHGRGHTASLESVHGSNAALLPQGMPSDATVEVFPPDIVKHHGVVQGGMGTEVVQATRRERTEFHFDAPVHLLALFERGARVAGESSVDGLPRSSLKDFEHKLIFVPAGHRYDDWQVPRTLTRVIYFYLDPVQPPMTSALAPNEAALSPRLFFEDAAVCGTALKLAALVESATVFNRLYFDALSLVLAHEVVRFACGRPRVEPRAHGGLAPWQQCIVVDYIEEHLDEQIPLVTLANLARLSTYYFCRAFKQSLGMPPHRYHTFRRVERAKSLLADANQSVTEVGLSLGFNETSSFTATFRKITGLTPTAYRRSLV
jgi:AraC family transcriptional regulator